MAEACRISLEVRCKAPHGSGPFIVWPRASAVCKPERRWLRKLVWPAILLLLLVVLQVSQWHQLSHVSTAKEGQAQPLPEQRPDSLLVVNDPCATERLSKEELARAVHLGTLVDLGEGLAPLRVLGSNCPQRGHRREGRLASGLEFQKAKVWTSTGDAMQNVVKFKVHQSIGAVGMGAGQIGYQSTSTGRLGRGALVQPRKLRGEATFIKQVERAQVTPRVFRICIVGERTSGTNWLAETLSRNFHVTIDEECITAKHWFHSRQMVQYYVQEWDLVLVVTRNAMDWLSHFWMNPHHSPAHCNVTFGEFLTHSWSNDGKNHSANAHCREMAESSDAYYEDYRTEYEGDYPVGPIRDVIQLRSMKLDNFLRIKDWMALGGAHYKFLRYEDLVRDAGVGMLSFVQSLQQEFTFQTRAEFPTVSTTYKKDARFIANMTHMEAGQVHYKRSFQNTPFTAAVVRMLLDRIDFAQERGVGYDYGYLQTALLTAPLEDAHQSDHWRHDSKIFQFAPVQTEGSSYR